MPEGTVKSRIRSGLAHGAPARDTERTLLNSGSRRRPQQPRHEQDVPRGQDAGSSGYAFVEGWEEGVRSG